MSTSPIELACNKHGRMKGAFSRVHRYIYVGYPARAKRLCTVNNAVRAVVAIYAAAFASQLTCFFQYDFTPLEVVVPGVAAPVAACTIRTAPFITSANETYFSVYWYVRSRALATVRVN